MLTRQQQRGLAPLQLMLYIAAVGLGCAITMVAVAIAVLPICSLAERLERRSRQ